MRGRGGRRCGGCFVGRASRPISWLSRGESRRGQILPRQSLWRAGADIVIGHHPHVSQPVELYEDGVIFYSLGNLVFDQETPPRDRSFLVAVDVTGDQLSFSLYPYTIQRGEVRLMGVIDGWRFLRELADREEDSSLRVSLTGQAEFSVPRSALAGQ